MTIDMSQFYQVFFDEASEHLGAMENLLLELDVDAPDLETLNAIFRAAHSIKGGAGTFGFSDMANVTHVLETLLDRLRKEETRPSVEMIDTFLEAGDVLKAQLAAHQEGGEFDDPRIEQVCSKLDALARVEAGLSVASTGSSVQDSTDEMVWLIEFHLEKLQLQPGSDPQALKDALGEVGRLDVLSEDASVPCVWRLTTRLDREAVLETFAFVCDLGDISVRADAQDSEDDGFGFFEGAPGSGDLVDQTPSDQDDAGFGFFAGAPGSGDLVDKTPSDQDDAGFGLFAGAPGSGDLADQTPSDQGDTGFGFFPGAPGSEVLSDHEGEGFGLFGGSPGMGEVVAVAEFERVERRRGYGFFASSPGAPEPKDEAASANQVGAGVTSRKGGAAPAKRASTGDSSIRVSIEKVDQLINLVGELVITHAMLAESASLLDPVLNDRIFSGLSNLERNSRDLQQAVMSIRMMPISFVFTRFPRVVRDTAATLGKRVSLKLIGEDTELDRGLIERLADPLNHLVRNSIDHGIELPERRREAGKPETGEIILRASHRGGSVVVEVTDDGAGLNRDKLLAKAQTQGIAMPDNPSDKEVWQLIFHPGFSTAEKVTDISGRGVGMDVVRRNIEEMNGRVDIDSYPGQGTHLTIRLPLTLAILDGLSVRMGEEIFILPMTAIQESIQPRREQFKSVSGRGRVVFVNGEYLSLIVLRDIFHLGTGSIQQDDGILVIVDTVEGRAALQVDELVAQHQVVIKSLETNYRKVDGVSGATIMGDGRVALILDVDALVRLNRKAA